MARRPGAGAVGATPPQEEDATNGGPGNMRPCGCHRGRPCTCEMGQRAPAAAAAASAEFACGVCINCQLNAKAVRKRRKPVRKCIKYDEFVLEQQYDHLQLGPGCVFRMRKPDWRVETKTAFYNRMRQLRLALLEALDNSANVIESQKRLRKKYNRDLVKAQAALKKLEEIKDGPLGARRLDTEATHVDSDVFDSFSKQLIPAETLLPRVMARLEAANDTILQQERNIVVIEHYVREFAVKRIQRSIREYFRFQRWKRVWRSFKEDGELAAAVEIQATYRKYVAMKHLRLLMSIQRDQSKALAATRLEAFFKRLRIARRILLQQQQHEANLRLHALRSLAFDKLQVAIVKITIRLALWKWKEQQRQATAHEEKRNLRSVTAIQRMFRGFRVRLYYRRMRYRHLLSDRVRTHFDTLVTTGDLWRFLFEIDADYKRYEEQIKTEKQDVSTFVSTVLREKKHDDDQMMQEWFTASALESPIVKGARHIQHAFKKNGKSLARKTKIDSLGSALSSAVISSPLAKDLVQMIPGNNASEVFPDDLPEHVVRQAIYEGFDLPEIVSVMRGLHAQGQDYNDSKKVVKQLKRRAPLMRNSWKPERIVRLEARTRKPDAADPGSPARVIPKDQMPSSSAARDVSDNLLYTVRGGMSGPIDQLLFVAGLKCFDLLAEGGKGAFVFPVERSQDWWRTYQHSTSPLVKIRHEQVVSQAIEPYCQLLTKMECWSAYDILKNVRGMDEMVSWGLPRPLVTTLYDCIEELHRQAVNIGTRSLKRQMMFTLQSEGIKCEQYNQPAEEDPVSEVELHTVAKAIEANVLQLPVCMSTTTAKEIIFKTIFLLCSSSDNGEAAESMEVSMLNKHNYDEFLRRVLQMQRTGDSDKLKALVEMRVHRAQALTDCMLEELARRGITESQVLHGTLGPDILHPEIQTQMRQLLNETQDHRRNQGMNGAHHARPRRANETTTNISPPTSLPIIRHGKSLIDKINLDTKDINFPFYLIESISGNVDSSAAWTSVKRECSTPVQAPLESASARNPSRVLARRRLKRERSSQSFSFASREHVPVTLACTTTWSVEAFQVGYTVLTLSLITTKRSRLHTLAS